VLSTGSYSTSVAWTSDGIFAASTVRNDPGRTRVGRGSGAAQAVTTTMDLRWDHGMVQALDRLPYDRLAHVAVCRPREDQVMILAAAPGKGWAGRLGRWEPLTQPDVSMQLQSQSWRPGLSAGLGQVGDFDCSSTVCLA